MHTPLASETPKSRVTSLDGLRGFAIATVLLFHYTYFRIGWVTISLFLCALGIPHYVEASPNESPALEGLS